jgi:hypothetical protein
MDHKPVDITTLPNAFPSPRSRNASGVSESEYVFSRMG